MGRIILGPVLLVLAITVIVGCSEPSESEGAATRAPEATATPTPRLSAQELLDEREANATRFDETRKGQWVTVFGEIGRIDNSKVYLVGDGFLSYVVLEDIPREQQIPLNSGDQFEATCKVGNYILGSMILDSCTPAPMPPELTATPVPNVIPTEEPPTATPRPIPAFTPAPTPTPVRVLTPIPPPTPGVTPTSVPLPQPNKTPAIVVAPTATSVPSATSAATPMLSPTATPTSMPTTRPTSTLEPVRGFGDGTWIVGADVRPGLYASPGGDFCYWERLSDFDGSPDAIISNDVGTSKPVVEIAPTDIGFQTSGCGRWNPVMEVVTPITTIPDGTWLVGEEIPAGTYSAPGSDLCYWVRLSGFGGTFDDIIANDVGGGRKIVSVAATDAGFKTNGCREWKPVMEVITPMSTIPDGTWLVGEEIPAGTYSAPGSDLCYWERLGGFGGTFDDIIANDVGGGRKIVSIAATDAGFKTNGCGEWTPIR